MPARLLLPLMLGVAADAFVVWVEPHPEVRAAAALGLLAPLVALWWWRRLTGEALQRWSRAVRHQLANRVQLIEGWTTLGRREEARRAIEEVEAFFAFWRQLDRLPPDQAAAWVELLCRCEETGTSVPVSEVARLDPVATRRLRQAMRRRVEPRWSLALGFSSQAATKAEDPGEERRRP
jgi:hypothetical protein